MLSKKVFSQSLLGHGLLLMIPATTPNIPVHYFSTEITEAAPLPFKPPFSDTLKTASFDSLLVKPFLVPKIDLNRQAFKFAKAYVKKEDEFLQKMKIKSPSYFTSIEAVLCRYDVPQQLKYLAIVESELRATAKSRVGAMGLWQLMPVTARELGLKVSGKNDERTHAQRSTIAAAKYLKSLHTEFGDWLLVLAAYNSGPGTVLKAIKKAGSRNFWVLQQYLPAESRGHVKRFISIHYFFEGEGSIATQTKAEAKAYQKNCDSAAIPVAFAATTLDHTNL